MQMTEFCGISLKNPAAVEFLQPEPNRADHDGACTHTHTHTHTHTLYLFRKLPEETVRKKNGLSELPYTLNWVPSNTNLIVSHTETTSDSDN